MLAYVDGVSTRAVDELVWGLVTASGISHSEVSRTCVDLDEAVAAVRDRRPHHSRHMCGVLRAAGLPVQALEQWDGAVGTESIRVGTIKGSKGQVQGARVRCGVPRQLRFSAVSHYPGRAGPPPSRAVRGDYSRPFVPVDRVCRVAASTPAKALPLSGPLTSGRRWAARQPPRSRPWSLSEPVPRRPRRRWPAGSSARWR